MRLERIRFFPSCRTYTKPFKHRCLVGVGGNEGDVKKRFVRLYRFLQDDSRFGVCATSAVLKNPVALDKLSGAALTKAAFAQIPVIGPIVLTVGLLTFVFSTILGWSYYGERAIEYLFGKKAIMPYRIAWVVAVYVGSVTSLALVWDLADAMNALMAIPNLVTLLTLNGVLVADTQKYLWDDGGLEAESEELAKELA